MGEYTRLVTITIYQRDNNGVSVAFLQEVSESKMGLCSSPTIQIITEFSASATSPFLLQKQTDAVLLLKTRHSAGIHPCCYFATMLHTELSTML